MPLHGLPFRLGLEVINPYLIIRDGGQEIVTLNLVTSKQLRADDFSLFLMLLGFEASRDPEGTHTCEYLTGDRFCRRFPYQ
jgi:hypothetical protein